MAKSSVLQHETSLPNSLVHTLHLDIKAKRSEHERHEGGDGLDDAVLERPELGEAKEGAAVRHRALQNQPERPGVLGRGPLLQDIHDLSYHTVTLRLYHL